MKRMQGKDAESFFLSEEVANALFCEQVMLELQCTESLV